MPCIVLTSEQTSVLQQAAGPVEIRDAAGRLVGRISAPISEAQIVARIQQERTAGVERYDASQVEQRLQRLEEIRQSEGMDEAKMRDLLRRMRAGESV